MTSSSIAVRLVAALALFGAIAGCTTHDAVFHDRSPEQVWTALVTACEQPEYEDWVLIENNAWVDPGYDRIEVYRRLRRDIFREGTKVVREEEMLELQFVLEPTDPPKVSGLVRNALVRVRGVAALDHVYNEMRELLGLVRIDTASVEALTDG